MIQIFNCEQGSFDWFSARAGIPTASEFSTVMAKGEGKTRKTYMLKLAGEVITGDPMPGFSNADMERGKVQEPEARDLYCFTHDIEPQKVGFIRNGNKGCSPDSLIDHNGGLEIKCALPHIQIERLLKDELPSEHKAQVYGGLWVAEREFWDFVSYCPKLPLMVKRVYRDEAYIQKIADEVARFNDELAQTIVRIRSYGAAA